MNTNTFPVIRTSNKKLNHEDIEKLNNLSSILLESFMTKNINNNNNKNKKKNNNNNNNNNTSKKRRYTQNKSTTFKKV